MFGNRSAVQVLSFLEAYGSGHALWIADTYSVFSRQAGKLAAADEALV